MQEQFRELILDQDKYQPPSSELPRTSDKYLYGLHVRSAEACERAMSKYYRCHRKFRLEACFAVLRSQVKDIVNWALRSNAGGSYEDDEPEAHSDPMRHVCQLQPYDEYHGNRITARRVFTERTDLMNRLTGTPHDNEPDWRDRNVRTIFNYNQSLQYTTQLKQDAIARDVTASTCGWVPVPFPGDSGGYRSDHEQP